MTPPETINLPRIRLRRPKISDAEAIFEFGSDPEVAHYADWQVRTTIEPLINSLHKRSERWESGEEFYWVITFPEEDRAIGGISCQVAGHAVEFGYLVHRRYWGNGIATEVTQGIVQWAFSNPPIWRVWATCDAENLASVRVLEKAGLTREGRLRRWAIRPQISNEPRDAFIYSRVRLVD